MLFLAVAAPPPSSRTTEDRLNDNEVQIITRRKRCKKVWSGFEGIFGHEHNSQANGCQLYNIGPFACYAAKMRMWEIANGGDIRISTIPAAGCEPESPLTQLDEITAERAMRELLAGVIHRLAWWAASLRITWSALRPGSFNVAPWS